MKSLKSIVLEKALHTGKKSKVGEVEFLKTSLKDKHIQDMLKELSTFTKKPLEELTKEAEAIYAKNMKVQTHEVLHGTSSQNMAEQVMFNLMDEYKFHNKDIPKFNAMTFKTLSNMIEAENEGMFPLHSIISKKSFEPKYIFVPSDTYKEFNDVETAAATNDGRFIYNIPFMQQLINFAYIKDVKPKGKKYKSNGGDIPDFYAPIEFLILHELLHLVQADNYYQKKYKANHKIINYVGDFRSNHELVKVLGKEHQLPIGLYSDMVNYDRQSSYKEMYDLVKKSLEENKQNQEKDKKKNKQQGEPSEGEGESTDSEESDDGLESHDSHTTEHDSEDIDNEHKEEQKKEKGSSEEESENSEPTKEEMKAQDKKHEEIKDALSKRKEVSTAEEAKKQKGERGSDKGNDSSANVELKNVVGVNWKNLLDRLVKKVSKSEMTTSYAKIHKRSIASVTLASQGVPASVKPGEVIANEEKQKLIFVIDSSGSMMSAISKIHSQIMHTIDKYNKGKEDEFYIVKFSNVAEVYKCSFKKKAYIKVHLDEISSNKTTALGTASKNILNLMEVSIGGATNFGTALVTHLSKATKNGASVIIFTDADVLYGENKKELQVLFNTSVKSSIGMVFSQSNEYSQFLGAFGTAYDKFVTVLE